MNRLCYIFIFALLTALAACSLSSDTLPEVHPNTSTRLVEQLTPTVTIDADNPNTVLFTMQECPGIVGVWIIAGKYYPQNVVSRHYEFQGNYTVQAFAYNANGTCPPVNLNFSIEQNDESVCLNTAYKALTGGCQADNGKTWKLLNWSYGETDKNASWENKFEAGNSMDDRITFCLNADKQYTHITNGMVDYEWTATPCDNYTASWDLNEVRGGLYLSFTNSGFLPPHATLPANNNEYLILTLNDTLLFVKQKRDDTDANAFYYTYTPE